MNWLMYMLKFKIKEIYYKLRGKRFKLEHLKKERSFYNNLHEIEVRRKRFKLKRLKKERDFYNNLHEIESFVNSFPKETRAYFAGLIDGEGCFYCSKPQNSNNIRFPLISITIANTHHEVIEEFHKILNIKHNIFYTHPKRGVKEVAVLRIINTNEIIKCIMFVKPFLRILKEKADILLEICLIKARLKNRLLKEDENEYKLKLQMNELARKYNTLFRANSK